MPLAEPADMNVTFSNGYPARVEFWSCLLCAASGVPFFPGIDLVRVLNGNANTEIGVAFL